MSFVTLVGMFLTLEFLLKITLVISVDFFSLSSNFGSAGDNRKDFKHFGFFEISKLVSLILYPDKNYFLGRYQIQILPAL